MPDTNVVMPSDVVSTNPATGKIIERFTRQTDEEVEQLLAAAGSAFQKWRAFPISARVAVYRAFAKTLRAQVDKIAPVITAEMGKILAESKAETEKWGVTAI